MEPNNSLKGLMYPEPTILQNMEVPPNTGTNVHNWVLGFTSKNINSSFRHKRISDEFLILGVSSVCLDSTNQVEVKSAHKMTRSQAPW
jgi:hypothetical protein